jgi:hypothetical protein
VIDKEAESVGREYDVALRGDVSARVEADGCSVSKRVFGEDDIAVLPAMVVNLEVAEDVRIVLERLAQFFEGKVFMAFIDLHLLQAENVGTGGAQISYDPVVVGLGEASHAAGVVREDGERVCACGTAEIKAFVGDKKQCNADKEQAQEEEEYA